MTMLLWPDLKDDIEKLLLTKLDPNGRRGLFFGLRAHPIHEICKACGKQVDIPGDRKCPNCGVACPVRNPLIQYHSGQDIPKPLGTPICLPWPGTISKQWFDPKVKDGGYGGGNSIVVRHTEGPMYTTGYCHQFAFAGLVIGQTYPAGTEIGRVGTTGDSTGPHLHFTCRKLIEGKSTLVDPFPELLAACGICEIPWHEVG